MKYRVSRQDLEKSMANERLDENEYRFFYKGLPKTIVTKLYTMYRADFILFDYMIDDELWENFAEW